MDLHSQFVFQQHMFPFLRVPELSICLSHRSSQLTNFQKPHSRARMNFSMPFKKLVTNWTEVNSRPLLALRAPFITSHCEPHSQHYLLFCCKHDSLPSNGCCAVTVWWSLPSTRHMCCKILAKFVMQTDYMQYVLYVWYLKNEKSFVFCVYNW